MERPTPSEFDLAVERARARAVTTGELRPTGRGLAALKVPDDLAEFARQVLTDGTLARAVEEIGREDQDFATI